MKNHNFVGLAIMLLIILAVQSLIGITKLGYIAARGIHSMVKPQSAMAPSATYAPIFEPVNEPIAPIAQIIKPVPDPWGEVVTVNARKPRKRSIAQLIQEEAS